MPITLGCPACGKRFRARDESAGKRVKCPYCAAAVPVPTPEEAAAAGAPTSVVPPAVPSSAPPARSAPPAPASVASPEAWGAGSSAPAAEKNPFAKDAASAPSPPAPPLPIPERKAKPAPKPAPKPVPKRESTKTPEQVTAAAWKKARGGLFWVLFALLLLSIPGFVGFGKVAYVKNGQALPQGDGWVSIPGYVNDDVPNAVRMTKTEQLDVALYAVPVFLGGLMLVFGRLTCGAAPRSSGSGGLFACSGLFTLLGLACLVAAAGCDRLLFKEEYLYAAIGFVILAGLAEFWFLVGLAASGLSLKRPSVARAVGVVGFLFALAAVIPTIGWIVYTQQWRPKPLNDDWVMYEQAALMLGWLLLIGAYWRAVRGLRMAIRDSLEGAE